jgi:hypothetical protein
MVARNESGRLSDLKGTHASRLSAAFGWLKSPPSYSDTRRYRGIHGKTFRGLEDISDAPQDRAILRGRCQVVLWRFGSPRGSAWISFSPPLPRGHAAYGYWGRD